MAKMAVIWFDIPAVAEGEKFNISSLSKSSVKDLESALAPYAGANVRVRITKSQPRVTPEEREARKAEKAQAKADRAKAAAEKAAAKISKAEARAKAAQEALDKIQSKAKGAEPTKETPSKKSKKSKG